MDETLAIDPQDRADHVGQAPLDFDTKPIGRLFQGLALGNHFQNDVLKLKHAAACQLTPMKRRQRKQAAIIFGCVDQSAF